MDTPRYYSIKRRVLLWTLCLLLLAVLPSGLYTLRTFKTEAERDAAGHALSILRSLEATFARQQAFSSMKDLHDWAESHERQTGIRFSYIVNGTVLADSSVAFDRLRDMDDHSLRPELRAAQAHGEGSDMRTSATTRRRYIYAAIKTEAIPGIPAGLARIALAEQTVADHVARISMGLLAIFALCFTGAGIIACYLLHKGFGHLERVAMAAQAIGLGEYHRRLPDSLCRELRPILAAFNGMAHNIELQLTNISEEKSCLEAVLRGMREGVIVIDAQERIQLYNPAALAMFPTLAGGESRLLIQGTMQPALHDAVSGLLRANPSSGRELRIRTPQGKTLEVSWVPLPDTPQSRGVLVFVDVSERARLEEVRRDFVANVSHELRTPLTSIQGYTETLRKSPDLPEETRDRFLDVIERNAGYMARITDSLLSLARSEHQQQNAPLETVDALSALHGVIQTLEPQMTAKKIRLETRFASPRLPVRANMHGSQEVFRNILENAMQYGGGSIVVSSEISDGNAQILVRDHGKGIPEESRDRVFERFFRLDRGQPSDGSAGLGLAICRHIMRGFGGGIRILSPEDGGAGVVLAVSFIAAEE